MSIKIKKENSKDIWVTKPDDCFIGKDFPDVLVKQDMCDWCGVRPVIYRDEAYSLCEICEDQLFGD